MGLITLIIVLVVVGVILWFINTKITMDNTIKQILNIAVVVVVALWVLSELGIFAMLNIPIRIP